MGSRTRARNSPAAPVRRPGRQEQRHPGRQQRPGRQLAPVRPLSVGIWATVLVGVAFTDALAAGVGIYGLSILALGLALYTQSTSASPQAPVTRAEVVS